MATSASSPVRASAIRKCSPCPPSRERRQASAWAPTPSPFPAPTATIAVSAATPPAAWWAPSRSRPRRWNAMTPSPATTMRLPPPMRIACIPMAPSTSAQASGSCPAPHLIPKSAAPSRPVRASSWAWIPRMAPPPPSSSMAPSRTTSTASWPKDSSPPSTASWP